MDKDKYPAILELCEDLDRLTPFLPPECGLRNWKEWFRDEDIEPNVLDQERMEVTLFTALITRLKYIPTEHCENYKILVSTRNFDHWPISILEFALVCPSAHIALRIVDQACRTRKMPYERIISMDGMLSDKEPGSIVCLGMELTGSNTGEPDEDDETLEADEDETCDECGKAFENCTCEEDEDEDEDDETCDECGFPIDECTCGEDNDTEDKADEDGEASN